MSPLIPQNLIIQKFCHAARVYNGRDPGSVHFYGQHFASHELIYKWSGSSISTVNGEEYALNEGAVLYLPKGPNTGYSVKTLQNGEAIDLFLELSEPLFDRPTLLPAPHRPAIAEMFADCHCAWMTGGEEQLLHCLSLAYGILAELRSEITSKSVSSRAQTALNAGLEYLSSRCFDPHIDYEDMAANAGVSYSYLKRLFITRLGVAPSRYVALRRLEYARDCLAATQDSITSISQQAGYSSVYYFSRVFRQEFGQTPSEYRASMR